MKFPITLPILDRRGKAKNVTLVFQKLRERAIRTTCLKCDASSIGVEAVSVVSGGSQRGNAKIIHLCYDCCIQYGWTDSELDTILTDNLMGQRSW